jgi:hypothetical protein
VTRSQAVTILDQGEHFAEFSKQAFGTAAHSARRPFGARLAEASSDLP